MTEKKQILFIDFAYKKNYLFCDSLFYFFAYNAIIGHISGGHTIERIIIRLMTVLLLILPLMTDQKAEASEINVNPLINTESQLTNTHAQSTVEQKVAQIAASCVASGAETEYEKAVWLHDWLTHNANYDYSYSIYGPEGVLMHPISQATRRFLQYPGQVRSQQRRKPVLRN